jgi:hypothetical protein
MKPTDPPNKRLYAFGRKLADGSTTKLTMEHWAVDADAAMRYLTLSFGYTAKGGWFARDVTFDQAYRDWAGR